MENWKKLENTDNNYSISDIGRVRNNKTNRILKDSEFKNRSYRRISLKVNGKLSCFFIHRLVLIYFKPIHNMEKLDVNHKNFNVTDNRLENLEWLEPEINRPKRNTSKLSYQNYKKLLYKHGDNKLNNILLTLL